MKLGDPRLSSIFDQFKNRKQFLTAWDEMMFIIKHIEKINRMSTTGEVSTETNNNIIQRHQQQMPIRVTAATRASEPYERKKSAATTNVKNKNIDRIQHNMRTRSTAAKITGEPKKQSEQALEVTAATTATNVTETGLPLTATRVKNNDEARESVVQKITKSKYPIVILRRMTNPVTEIMKNPDTSATKSKEKDMRNTITSKCITRQQAKLNGQKK